MYVHCATAGRSRTTGFSRVWLSPKEGAFPLSHSPVHLRTTDLARRWGVSTGWLANMRSAGTGPSYLKLGSRVLYPLVSVESYEADALVRTQGAA